MKLRVRSNLNIILLLLFTIGTACTHTGEISDDSESTEEEVPREVSIEAYAESLPEGELEIEMVPVNGGTFVMGHPEGDGEQLTAEVSPFWMSAHEVTWDLYEMYLLSEEFGEVADNFDPEMVDAVTMPSLPYVDPVSGMGRGRNPAINMTQYAALAFTRWLTLKTGHFYRLPTEAEWEYACRAGTDTAYHFGDSPEKLDEYAWYRENSDRQYHEVGSKKANSLGLYDMHGNVAEWTLDQFTSDYHAAFSENGGVVKDPWVEPTSLEPRAVRGGSWNHPAEEVTCFSRIASDPGRWKRDDPQMPQSIWWNSNSPFVGFRVVRPAHQPSREEIEAFWEQTLDQFYYE